MLKDDVQGIRDVLPYLPERMRDVFSLLQVERLSAICELRLRAGFPIQLIYPDARTFLTVGGKEVLLLREGLFAVSQAEIDAMLSRFCGYSAHSHQNDFINGCISIAGGHRIGLCGTAVTENGNVVGLRNITGMNIRIAKSFETAAGEILKKVYCNGPQSILLAGPPASGKSTVLRAMAQKIASGETGKYYKCAVLDERSELFPQNQKESLCYADILYGYTKPQGISVAVRTLSPDIIFCDEIGGKGDADAILDGIYSGVSFIATVHAQTPEAIWQRDAVSRLLRQNVFGAVVFLGAEQKVGQIIHICKAGETDAESSGFDFAGTGLYGQRTVSLCTGA